VAAKPWEERIALAWVGNYDKFENLEKEM